MVSSTDFRLIPLLHPDFALSGKIDMGAPGTMNEPAVILTDGKLARNYGPIFANGVVDGKYRMDLGTVLNIAEIRSYSHNQNGNRASQSFTLYGSASPHDPGWNQHDPAIFVPIFDMEKRETAGTFLATRIASSGGRSLGSFRWLMWAVSPVTPDSRGENTAFQEFQVKGFPGNKP